MVFKFSRINRFFPILFALAFLTLAPSLGETTEELDALFYYPKTTSTAITKVYDPMEKLNRRIFKMNSLLFKYLKSSANKKLFRGTNPGKSRAGRKSMDSAKYLLLNIADNLSEPSYVINHFLQGNPKNAVVEFWRFFINSTLGILGTFDVAQTLGLEKKATSYRKTLTMYGMKNGPFIMFPLFGATSLRNSIAALLEILTNPLNLVIQHKFIPFTVYNCSRIAREIDYYNIVFENSIDPYIKLRTFLVNYDATSE
ncbi:MlaA family lipoprotein [Neorickettsia risticii]|uniref:VacJ lipoprotein n=1 Tax=Neorickettsia risticii (strain Illinois) TaxID=434131 RepID=C6V644_NEORI|nr:MlaA family lipoprotein [Neorickettsia risticii]ACT69850.1 putative VacJ lipoprotein [Neorickettsia risticii str. Illinois]